MQSLAYPSHSEAVVPGPPPTPLRLRAHGQSVVSEVSKAWREEGGRGGGEEGRGGGEEGRRGRGGGEEGRGGGEEGRRGRGGGGRGEGQNHG